MATKVSYSSTLRGYGETTSVKGIPKVIKNKDYFLRSLWFFAVIFGAAFATFQVTSLVIRYYSRPTVTKVETFNEEPTFPDVTLCNLNPLTSDMGPWTMEEYIYNLWYVMGNMSPAENQHITTGNNIMEEEYDQIMDSIYSVSGFFQNFPYDESIAAIYASKFIIDCMFYDWEGSTLDIECDNMTVRPFQNPNYFICFTVQVPEDYKEHVQGLSIISYLDVTDHAIMQTFSPNIKNSKSNGVKVKIHPRDTFPALTGGKSLGPGQESTISLSKVRIEMLPAPYGSCTTKQYLEYEADDTPTEEKPLLYTKESCSSYCRQEVVMRECGCIDPDLGVTTQQFMSAASLPACGDMFLTGTMNINKSVPESWMNLIEYEHISRYWNSSLCALRARDLFESECFCLDPCTQEYHEMSIAQAEWPMVDYELAFYERYIKNSVFAGEFSYYGDVQTYYETDDPLASEIVDMLRNTTKLRDNFLQVNVIFDDPRIEVSSEKPAMTWDTILGTLGGGLNLWIGITFLTLIELVDLGYKLVLVCNKSGKNNDNDGDIEAGPKDNNPSDALRNSRKRSVVPVTHS